ncbi:MAG: hypothetical protein K0U16_07595 [Gammaproteobacteria bacterium]|nr:hypothetical protein [Gammaproteobacteria bacterium]
MTRLAAKFWVAVYLVISAIAFMSDVPHPAAYALGFCVLVILLTLTDNADGR